MCATEGAKVIATDMNSSLLEELKGEDPREPHVACARTHSGGGGGGGGGGGRKESIRL